MGSTLRKILIMYVSHENYALGYKHTKETLSKVSNPTKVNFLGVVTQLKLWQFISRCKCTIETLTIYILTNFENLVTSFSSLIIKYFRLIIL